MIKLKRGAFYVVDQFADGGAQVISEPFDTRQLAENERRQLNIADDCVVMSAEEIVERSRKSA